MRVLPAFIAGCALIVVAESSAQDAKSKPGVAAVVESSLPSATGHIRQFVLDGDANTCFVSAKNADAADHLTVRFDKPVSVKSIAVTTGKPAGGDALEAGVLEVSADSMKFEALTTFAEGKASAEPKGRQIQAVRVKPSMDLKHPLTIREFVIESDPAVAVFKYPVEFKLDVSDAPEMKDWIEKAARVCEREYTMINEELKSEGFKPRTEISMTLKNDYKGVAAAGGGRITGSVKFFKDHPDDIGAMVHETVHVVQSYRTRNNPGWLVEGIADYVRFFKYEPGKIGRLNVERARYDASYRVTAAFLAWTSTQYDKDLVKKLNKAMREGEYREEIWKTLTKKTVQELGDEWKTSLKK